MKNLYNCILSKDTGRSEMMLLQKPDKTQTVLNRIENTFGKIYKKSIKNANSTLLKLKAFSG